MARTKEEIRTEILNKKATFASLNALSSGIAVALYNIWIDIVVFAHWTLEVLFDKHQEEVNTTIANQKPTVLGWYAAQAKLFQNGDALVWDATVLQYKYPAINSANQIVRFASATENGGIVTLKVAGADSGGLPVALSVAQKSAFSAYAQKIKAAGTDLVINSFNPDVLFPDYTMYYNPEVFTASTAKDAVLVAVQDYLKALDFDGVVHLNRVQDVIEKIGGITAVVENSVKAKRSGGAYTAFSIRYVTDAGYIVLDAASPIYNLVNYRADV